MDSAVVGDLIIGTLCILFIGGIIAWRTWQFFRNTINQLDYLTFLTKVVIMTIVCLGFLVTKLMFIHVIFESSIDNSLYVLFNFIIGSLVTFITVKTVRDKSDSIKNFVRQLLKETA